MSYEKKNFKLRDVVTINVGNLENARGYIASPPKDFPIADFYIVILDEESTEGFLAIEVPEVFLTKI